MRLPHCHNPQRLQLPGLQLFRKVGLPARRPVAHMFIQHFTNRIEMFRHGLCAGGQSKCGASSVRAEAHAETYRSEGKDSPSQLALSQLIMVPTPASVALKSTP